MIFKNYKNNSSLYTVNQNIFQTHTHIQSKKLMKKRDIINSADY